MISVILQLMFQFLVHSFTVRPRRRSRLDINLSTAGDASWKSFRRDASFVSGVVKLNVVVAMPGQGGRRGRRQCPLPPMSSSSPRSSSTTERHSFMLRAAITTAVSSSLPESTSPAGKPYSRKCTIYSHLLATALNIEM